eukprot:UN08432
MVLLHILVMYVSHLDDVLYCINCQLLLYLKVFHLHWCSRTLVL